MCIFEYSTPKSSSTVMPRSSSFLQISQLGTPSPFTQRFTFPGVVPSSLDKVAWDILFRSRNASMSIV